MELEELNTSRAHDNTPDRICCICLENLSNTTELISKLNCCKQVIHKECLVNWILQERSSCLCPICRHFVNLQHYITIPELLHHINENMNNREMNANYINDMLQRDYNITCVVVPEGRVEENAVTRFSICQIVINCVHFVLGIIVLFTCTLITLEIFRN